MQVFENIATFLAFLSVGVLIVCTLISSVLAINFFNIGRFYEKFKVFYKNIFIFFCLPVYDLSFLSKGISEKDSALSFVLAAVLFLIFIVLINRKKIKKIIERRKKK